MNQRWLQHRDYYRRPEEPIITSHYEVEAIVTDAPAKAFVCEHHYSRSFPAARFRYGLYRADRMVGVAVFSQPINNKVLSVLPGDPLESVDLGRFVLLDEVPGNGETWFLARCFDFLRREGLIGVTSSSDPHPRRTAAGAEIMPGHVGTIYQAHNAIYLGRSTPRTLRILPDGRVFSDRAIQKIRRFEQGWRYSSQILVRFGATELHPDLDPRVWLAEWLPRLTHKVRHRGNHRYVWAIDRRVRKHLPAGVAYPKQIDSN